jgi:hypothetical protein
VTPELDLTPMARKDSTTDTEAQSLGMITGFGRKKGLENTILYGDVDAITVVGNSQDQHGFVFHGFHKNIRFRTIAAGIQGILNQTAEHIDQLMRLTTDRLGPGQVLEFKMHLLSLRLRLHGPLHILKKGSHIMADEGFMLMP